MSLCHFQLLYPFWGICSQNFRHGWIVLRNVYPLSCCHGGDPPALRQFGNIYFFKVSCSLLWRIPVYLRRSVV